MAFINRTVLPFAVIAVLLFICCGCGSNDLSFSINDAESIDIMSGTSGRLIVISNPEDVSQITENICSLKFLKGGFSGQTTGWSYRLTWYNADGEPIEHIVVTDENTIDYDGRFYKVIESGEIDTAFFKAKLSE